MAYAEGNICTLFLENPRRNAEALGDCSAARQVMQRVAQDTPEDPSSQLDFANRLAWEADAMAIQGRYNEAVWVRRHQLSTVLALANQSGSDARNLEAVLLAQYGLAKALKADGKADDAIKMASAAMKSALELQSIDPKNQSWSDWLSKLARDFPNH